LARLGRSMRAVQQIFGLIKIVTIIAAFAMAATLLSCGEASPTKDIKEYVQQVALPAGEPWTPLDPYNLDPAMGVHAEGFSLWVVDDTGRPNAELTALYRLERKTLADGETMVTISVHGSPGIPHSLLYLRYEYTEFSPKETAISDFFGNKNERISMVVSHTPGLVSIGVARLHPEKGMPTGDGTVATVSFLAQPFDESRNRAPASAPKGDWNRVTTLVANTNAGLNVELRWTEVNTGDYNNDGEVGVADITPIALRFGNIVGDGVEDHIDRYVDGDKSEEIGVSDITPIAVNYLSVVSGYRVYRHREDQPGFVDPFIGSQGGPLTVWRPSVPEDNSRPVYTFIDTQVEVGQGYTYKVVPYDTLALEEGVESNTAYEFVTPATDTTPPVWVAGTGITNSVAADGIIKIWFGRAEDAESPPVQYVLRYATSPIGQASDVRTIVGVTSPFYLGSDPGHNIVNGTEYYMLVRARDSADPYNETSNPPDELIGKGRGTPQSGSTADILPPEWDDEIGITQVLSGDGQLSISFGSATDAGSPPVRYRLYYAPGNGPIIKDQATVVNDIVSPHLLTGLANDQVYSLLVTALDGATVPNETENVEFSLGMPSASGNPDLTPPVWIDQPGIKAVIPGDGSARVTWHGATDADTPPVTYSVYWEEDDGTPPLDYGAADTAGRVMHGLSGESALVIGLTNGVAYRFGVRAADSATPPNLTQNTNSLIATPESGLDTEPPIWITTSGITGAAARNQGADISWGDATDVSSPPVTFNIYWEEDTGSGPVDFLAAEAAGRTKLNVSGNATIVTNLINNRTYRFSVRARDAVGNEDDNTESMTVTPAFTGNFTLTTIDNVGDTGFTPSIAQAPEGWLGIAYYDQGNGTLKYASNESGSWVTETVYTPPVGEVHGPFPSLAFDAMNRPHIVYLDWTDTGDASPTTRVLYVTNDGSWTNYEVVDRGTSGDYDAVLCSPRIAIGPGNIPVVCYTDATNQTLMRTEKNGSNWEELEVTDSFVPGGFQFQVQALRAEPVYFDPGGGQTIGIAYYSQTDGASFSYLDLGQDPPAWVNEVVAGEAGAGLYLDLALDLAGKPVMTFQNAVTGKPMYAKRTGADSWEVEDVDAPRAGNGFSTAVGVINSGGTGIAAAAWFDQNNLGARYAIDKIGEPGFLSPMTVDPTTAGTGFFLSMLVDNVNFTPGRAYIAYTAPNGNNRMLKLAVRNS